MKITFTHQSRQFEADLEKGHDISRPVYFLNGTEAEPGFVPLASRLPFSSGDFIGAVEKGGPCNVDSLSWIPHCHGTHTETAAHILKYPWEALKREQEHSVPVVRELSPKQLLKAILVTVDPVKASESNDTYRPNFEKVDRIISGDRLDQALSAVDSADLDAILLRTDNQIYDFNSGPETPFISVEAMNSIVKFGVKHLLLDLPSVDRLDDGGHLTAHHIFWNVPEHESVATRDSWLDKTITEMIHVDQEIEDGLYVLNLQCAPLVSDAAPSRPILYPTTEV